MKVPPALLVTVYLLVCTNGALAQPGGETVWLPMQDRGMFGERTIRLEATLYRPEGTGPFPVLIFNHGSSGGPIPPSHTENPRTFGAYLAAKGVALIMPMRRGRGKSGGSNNEEPSACALEAAKHGLRYASEALDAVYAYLRRQPWAATDRIVLAGHSRGGILASAYAAEHPGAASAVINFSGGWKDDKCGPVDINAVLFGEAGARSRVPNLFLYARGDAFYSDRSMEGYAGAFEAAGGEVTFRLLGVEGINGHQLFHRGMEKWRGSVDDFLQRLGIGKGAN